MGGLPGILGAVRAVALEDPLAARGSGRSFAVTVLRVVGVAAFLSPLVRSSRCRSRAPNRSRPSTRPSVAVSPLTFTYKDRDYPIYNVPLPDGTTKQLALDPEGPEAEPVRRPVRSERADGAADQVGRQLARPDRGHGLRPALRELANVWNEIKLSEAAVEHDPDRADRDDRDGGLVHARRLRLRPVPLPRAGRALPSS
jgi:hypothetical protein